jgi:tRNA(His) 5'-end guanylyltransferase
MKQKVSKDSLGNRMKDIESRTRYYLPRRTYNVLRLDGKSFHTFTKKYEKPFDMRILLSMQHAAIKLCDEVMGCKIGYTQSDEISLCMTDFDDIETQAYFDGNIQKICSVSASIATAHFNDKLRDLGVQEKTLACFDARIYSTSDPWEAYNAFLWRQNDAVRNSIQGIAQSLFAHKQLQGKNCTILKEMIAEKGSPWEEYSPMCKWGAFIVKGERNWIADKNSPLIIQNKKYFFDRIPLLEGVKEIYSIKNETQSNTGRV